MARLALAPLKYNPSPEGRGRAIAPTATSDNTVSRCISRTYAMKCVRHGH